MQALLDRLGSMNARVIAWWRAGINLCRGSDTEVSQLDERGWNAAGMGYDSVASGGRRGRPSSGGARGSRMKRGTTAAKLNRGGRGRNPFRPGTAAV